MRRSEARFAFGSSFVLAVMLTACGSSSPVANGKGGNDGGSDAATGAAGATGSAGSGSPGAAGDTGSAGSTAGDAGAGGTAGVSGGTAGAMAGSGGAGKGAAGSGGTSGGTAGTGAGGAKADGGTDAAATSCTVGTACADGFTCINMRTCGPNREQFCFCDPNGKVACEGCTVPDGGTSTDGGVALKACPGNVKNGNATCTMNEERCSASACTNNQEDECICAISGAATTGRWFCAKVACQ